MLDSLLVTLGSAAIGGALVYLLWSVATRRLAAFHAARAKRRVATHAAPPPAVGSAAVAGGDDGVAEIDGLAEIRDSIVELARAQVSIIERLDEAARTFDVLIVKTDMALPYTSVFLELDCGYWSGESESALRERMRR